MNKKFYLMMFIAMTLWGGSWVSGKLISGGSSNFQFVFWRFLITAVCFLLIILYRNSRKLEKPGFKNVFKNPFMIFLLILSGIALTGYNFMFIIGLSAGLAGKGGVIVTSLNPLIGFIIGTVIYKNTFTGRAWTGILLGVVGGFILVEPWKYSLTQLIDGGNLIFVAGAVFWAMLTALGHRVQKLISLWEFNFLIYTAGTFLTVPFIWNLGLLNWSQYNVSFWINTVYLAVFAGALAGGIYFHASRMIGSAKTGSFTFIVPGAALLFSFLLLGEIPELSTVTGGTLAVTAVYLINSSSDKTLRKNKNNITVAETAWKE